MSNQYNNFGVARTPIGTPSTVYGAFGVVNSNLTGLSTIPNVVTESVSPQALNSGVLNGDINSANFVHLVSGWKISANGDAEFQSLVGVNLTGTNISGATITGSTITGTTITGGTIKTSNTSTRVELNSNDNALYVYASGVQRVSLVAGAVGFYDSGGLQGGGLQAISDQVFRISSSDSSGDAVLVDHGDFTPENDNFTSCGTASNRWTEVWAVDGSINTSDIRIKENIIPLNYGLSEIMKLEPIRYSMYGKDNKIGFSAQAVSKVIPEVTVNCEDTSPIGAAGMRPTDLIPVLVNAIKELKAELDILKSRVDKSV